MSTGKIVATVVGLTAAVLLINQLCNNSSNTNVTEDFINVALRSNVHTNNSQCGSRRPAVKLTSDLPDSVFFSPTASYQPRTVIGATNFVGNSVGGGGARLNMPGAATTSMTGMNVQQALNSFESFEQAAGIAEHYENVADTASHGHGHRRGHDFCPKSIPVGCGRQGTIANGYGQSNLVGADFSAIPGGKGPLLEPSGVSYTSELPVASLDAPGGVSAMMTDRLVYSTLARARCPGTTDFIRGDLPIVACGQYMQTAARPADSLQTGAMAALFGLQGTEANQTSALVSQDASLGALTALSGMDLAHLVEQGPDPPAITKATFASTSAELMANRLANMDVARGTRVGSNSINGDASAYVGTTSFA